MKNIKEIAASSKTFVQNHRVAIAVITTATATTAVYVAVRKGVNDHLNKFLQEHDLVEEFAASFNPEN